MEEGDRDGWRREIEMDGGGRYRWTEEGDRDGWRREIEMDGGGR